MRRIVAQARVELTLAFRQGERMLVTLGIPVGILVFFSVVDVLPHAGRAVDFLVPGTLALSALSTAMVSLGIATGFERQAGILRRLGVTPLGRSGLLAAKTIAVLATEVIQAAAIVGVGVALGWRVRGSAPTAAALVVTASVAYASIAFVLAGRLRAEANLAAANGLFLVLLMLGGIVVPVGKLPRPLETIAKLLPVEPLAHGLRTVLSGGGPAWTELGILAAWAVLAVVAAVAAFRWD